jgi:hypothetical protein
MFSNTALLALPIFNRRRAGLKGEGVVLIVGYFGQRHFELLFDIALGCFRVWLVRQIGVLSHF